MADSITDSTPYSISEGRLSKPRKVVKLDELMKEDTTPLSEPTNIHRQAQSPTTHTAVQTLNERNDVLEIVHNKDPEKTTVDLDPQLIFEGKKPPINQEQFDKKHGFRRTNLSIVRKLVYQLNLVRTWKRVEWIHFWRRRIPLLSWLPTYDWREDFLRDVINGIMISILYIPQGLAYGMMVGVPPIYGIYTGIVGPLVYTFLGTSHQASTGAYAIVSLMVGSVVEQASNGGNKLDSDTNSTPALCCSERMRNADPMEAVKISSLLAFYVGIIQVVLGLLNAGLLAVWLSDQLVEGLTSGAAVHVLFSQLKSMTGMRNLPRTSDNFGIIKFAICFSRNMNTISYQTAICSFICCAFLLFSKMIVDPILKPWMKIKFPMELLVVIFSIVLSYLGSGTPFDLNVAIVGEIEAGMKAPTMHDFSYTDAVICSAFSIAIVSFVIHIALAKLVAKGLNYQVNANQEWLALGSMHTIASFFGCFAGGSSLSRTITSANLGTKSQLSTVVVVSVLLIVVFGAAPLFTHLPKPVLSCIVVIAMKDLYVQLYFSHRLFHQSIIDFFIFAVTFSATVLINVNLGLAIGIVFALLTVVLRSQWAESVCMGRIPGTSDFKGIGHYRAAMEVPGIKVFRFDAPLYFANAELFLTRMHRATGLDPLMILAELKGKEKKKKRGYDSIRGHSEKGQKIEAPDEEIELTVRRRCVQSQKPTVDRVEKDELVQLTHIVVDCSSFPYIDLMGVDALARAHNDYKAINITVFFACCKVAVRQMFEYSSFYEHVPKTFMFVSLADAVSRAQYEQELQVRPPIEEMFNQDVIDSLNPEDASMGSSTPALESTQKSSQQTPRTPRMNQAERAAASNNSEAQEETAKPTSLNQ
uniref:Prestin n=1 Tax=Ascaris suum TaxID=6253 RepID=F1KUS8_ASCSU